MQVINSGSVDPSIRDDGAPLYKCKIGSKTVEDIPIKKFGISNYFGTGFVGMSPIAYGHNPLATVLVGRGKISCAIDVGGSIAQLLRMSMMKNRLSFIGGADFNGLMDQI